MSDALTKETLESYLKCKYKSYLYFLGKKGVKSDYEELLAESRLHFKQKAIQKILAHSSESEVVCNVTLTHQLLQQGARYIFNGAAKDGTLALLFDGLKKMVGPSKVANFNYMPILISESENIHSEERRLLALYGLVLASIQGRHPHAGLFIHGQQLKTTTIKLNSTDRKIRRVLEEIKDIQKK
jgi:predicted RecB family nuclease